MAKNKLKLAVKDSDNYRFYFNEPKDLTIGQRERLFKSLLGDLQVKVDDLFTGTNDNNLENKSISDVIYPEENVKKTKLDNFVDYWAFNYEIGSSPENYSALIYKTSSGIYENVPAFSDYYFAQKDGFSQIINYFKQEANLNENEIKFNDPVVEIVCEPGMVEVITKSGSSYKADFCICAVPVSVIAGRRIRIQPDLDSVVFKTLKKLRFSTYSRIFVELEKPIWTKHYDWLINLSENLKDDISLWQNPNDNPRTLIAHLCTFTETSSTILENRIENSLKNILEKNYKGISNFRKINLEYCPFSLGAFPCASSDFNVDDLISFKKINNLYRLIFAGDSYSLDYFGTVQGAVKSGIEAADVVYTKCSNENIV